MDGSNKLAVFLCIFFAMIFILIGVFIIFSHQKKLLRCSEVTEGIVVELDRGHTKSTKGYRPTVECTINGESVRLKSTVRKTFTSLKPGDAVVIHYNPQNGEMWIEGYDNNLVPYFMAVVFIFIGFMIGLLAILGLVFHVGGTVLQPIGTIFAVGTILCILATLVSAFIG